MTLNAKALEALRKAKSSLATGFETVSAMAAVDDAISALSSLPQAGVSEPLTSQERFLLEWLGKEESSALGECSGCDLDVLINRGFAVIAPAPEGQHRHFGRVSLTDAGRATLSCQQEEAVPVATMHRSDTEILFSKGYVPNMLGFTSSPLYASPVPADAGEPTYSVDEIMEQAQVFASAWSLIGGRFDLGEAAAVAEEARQALRTMLDRVPATSQAKAGGED